VLLAPGQEVMCEPGSLFHSDDGIEADADMGGCCNAMKRAFCAGEDLFRVHYVNKSQQPRTITLASPYPGGKIISIDLTKLSGLVMKKGAWSASIGQQAEFGYKLAKNLTTGCCAGQGLILSTVKGGGTSFLNAGGTVFQRVLGPQEKITIDTAALVACSESVDIGVRRAGTVMMMCCGGEGLFVCELTGPGLVIIQSMPVEKAAMTYYHYMPKQGEPPLPLSVEHWGEGGSGNWAQLSLVCMRRSSRITLGRATRAERYQAVFERQIAG
jgi:uncharacterized protein (AIM24 family)